LKETDVSSLLREVSRSFYLTLRVLPAAVRAPIGLAYLLARTTDNIADTEVLAVDLRLQALERWRERILGRGAVSLEFDALAQNQASAAERTLLRRGEEIIRLLDNCAEDDRRRIRAVLETIISGQELDLRRFGAANVKQIVALPSDAELDDYTFRVAGCVGEFWTDMCLAHLFRFEATAAAARLREQGVRFGKGLQLVNILRDLPRDLRNGRCYLPAARLAEAGLSPGDLLRADAMKSFRPLYDSYLDTTEDHLTAGWAYTNSLPRQQWRLHLACAWPILIAARTVRKLRVENVLDAGRRIKISRSEVYRLMVRSILLYPWGGLWEKQYETPPNEVASRHASR
jgi:farnesyl-diphosphate farnesyltransferase